jgi:hypothetical protein
MPPPDAQNWRQPRRRLWARRPEGPTATDRYQSEGGERDQASRHDYRPNLTRFLNEVYGLGATEDQLSRVELALAQREEARERLFERPKPKTRRGS